MDDHLCRERRIPELTLDFIEDLSALRRDALRRAGITLPSSIPAAEVLMLYHNVQRRLLSIRPRGVEWSREFSCPRSMRGGLTHLARKAQRGVTLNPHLSTRVRIADFDDGLFNDWGIYHFHLGRQIEPDGFVTRGGPLLFAAVTDDCFYCIDVRDHSSFASRGLLKIVWDNWKHLLERYRLPFDGDIDGPRYSDAEIARARRAGVSVCLTMDDGAVLRPPGGGISTSGRNPRVVRAAGDEMEIAAALERSVRESLPAIVDEASRRGVPLGARLRLTLRFDRGRPVAVSDEAQISIALPDPESLFSAAP
jgi:hypothetical protein